MPSSRFEPSSIKNKIKREEIARKQKKEKGQSKLQKRLAQAKVEADNPAAKKRRQVENVPRTLDNTREYDPSMVTANPASHNREAEQPVASSSSTVPPNSQPQDESAADISVDPFASYFSGEVDPTIPPKVLITTSQKATRITYEFCEELVSVLPGAELIRRKKGQGFEMGRIAGWAANREYSHLVVVNENMKKPNAITMVYLPNGPTAYFKLSSIELTKQISGHARSTGHFPELVLNGFVTRLGHTVGRLFQTLFPPMPEFQGRQVVTLHNQRDFLFFRRHRYAFRSVEKVQLQEIGPRFTLKLRSLRKGLPAVKNLGDVSKNPEFDTFGEDESTPESIAAAKNDENAAKQRDADMAETMEEGEAQNAEEPEASSSQPKSVVPPKEDEYVWMWKPDLETTRRTFFL